jgi:periplasmic divalent cation tolerance protein
MNQSQYSLFYSTFPDETSARKASEALLQEKLIACSNLFQGMQSQYWWQGNLETSRECVLIMKTRSDIKEKLESRLKSLHPYDIPCLIEIPLAWVSNPYLQWLETCLNKSLSQT